MIQVWKYDENKVFIESCMIEEIEENMTTVPLTIGYIKPKFNEEIQEWYEGATDEEVREWQEENQQPSKTKICKSAEELTVENEQLWETVQFLLKQVDMIPKDEEEVKAIE